MSALTQEIFVEFRFMRQTLKCRIHKASITSEKASDEMATMWGVETHRLFKPTVPGDLDGVLYAVTRPLENPVELEPPWNEVKAVD